MVKDVEKWWNEAAPWFQEWAKLSTESADYGPYAPRENQLKPRLALQSRAQFAQVSILHKPS